MCLERVKCVVGNSTTGFNALFTLNVEANSNAHKMCARVPSKPARRYTERCVFCSDSFAWLRNGATALQIVSAAATQHSH